MNMFFASAAVNMKVNRCNVKRFVIRRNILSGSCGKNIKNRLVKIFSTSAYKDTYTFRLKTKNIRGVKCKEIKTQYKRIDENRVCNINGEKVRNPSLARGGGYYLSVNEYEHDGNKDIGVSRKPVDSNSWESWYFPVDGDESIPDIDYWGSGKRFYATAIHSNKDYFYYIKIPDVTNPDSWTAHIVPWSGAEYNFDFYDSTGVACYAGKKVIYAAIISTDYPGYECDHAPAYLYQDGDEWSITWFCNLGGSKCVSIDIDQSNGIVYLAFQRGKSIYLFFNDYDNGLDDNWNYWQVRASDFDFMDDIGYPDVSAGYGMVYMTAQAHCNGDWDPWFFYSSDNRNLFCGWLLGTDADEMYPRVDLTYDGSHIIGNWVYVKNNALFSGPNDKISGDTRVSMHYRCCDVSNGHAVLTISGEDHISTNDIIVGGYTPLPYVDSIEPNPAIGGQQVSFKGHGWDLDGWVIGYNWSSSIDGKLSDKKEYSTSSLSIGVHTIYFSVKDNNNHWSYLEDEKLEVKVSITSTVFRPLNITGNMDYPYPYHSCDTKRFTLYGWETAKVSCNISSGVIAGYIDFIGGSAYIEAWQKIKFYTGRQKNINITVEIILVQGEFDVFAMGETDIGYCYNNGEPHWKTIDPLFDVDEALELILFLAGLLGAPVGGDIGTIINWATTFGNALSLIHELMEFLRNGDAKKYSINFNFDTKKGDNIVCVGAKSLGAGDGKYTSTFFGIVDYIIVDGIAPPSTPQITGPNSGAVGETCVFHIRSIDPNKDHLTYDINWGDGTTENTGGSSGETVEISHIYSKPGTYTIKVRAMDIDHMESKWKTHKISIKAKPDLACDGFLSWSDVEPGSTVYGSFQVKNIGQPGSELDWEIVDWPEWGIWGFSPNKGNDLRPEDDPITVTVRVTAPDEKNQDFTGTIKVVNKENPDDFDTIPVRLSTPKNRVKISPFFFEKYLIYHKIHLNN